LRIVGFLQIFYTQAVIPRTIVESPAFLEYVLGRKDRGLRPYNLWSQQVGGLDAFLYEAAQNFELFSKIQGQNQKNQKPFAVDVFFRAFPMIPLWGWSNLAGRALKVPSRQIGLAWKWYGWIDFHEYKDRGWETEFLNLLLFLKLKI
jgi:hypothetical protein